MTPAQPAQTAGAVTPAEERLTAAMASAPTSAIKIRIATLVGSKP